MNDLSLALIHNLIDASNTSAVFLFSFLTTFLDSVISIIPSSIMLIAAGFFSIDPSYTFNSALWEALVKIGVPGAIGYTAGAWIIYIIFYWGGKGVIKKYGHYFKLNWRKISKAQEYFGAGSKDEVVLFFARALPIWPIEIISIFCGVVRMPWGKFVTYSFLGFFFRTMLLGIAGWSFGEAYEYFAEQIVVWQTYGTIIVVAAIIVFFLYSQRLKVKNR
jgi:membrane protein DedA with SNARE-associated domain